MGNDVLAPLTARRRLGSTELEVSPIGLGTMQFGWTAAGVTAFEILDAYTGAGGNLIDTANMYGGNQSAESFAVNRAHVGVTESIIGRWLDGRSDRDDLVISTKVRARMWDGPDGEGLRRDHIIRAVEDSLRRLRTDRVEVLYAHWPDPEANDEEWLGAFDELIRAGKVRFAGTSNFCDFVGMGDLLSPLLDLADRSGLPRIRVEQPRYNLLNRDEYENRLQKIALAEDLGIVTYSSLAGGFLAAADREGPRAAHLARYDTTEGAALLAELRSIAAAHQVPPAAVAVAWNLAQPGITATLIGPDRVSQLAEASPAAELHLTGAELASLTALSWAQADAEFVEW